MAKNKDYKFVDEYGFDEELLRKAFDEAREVYKERGFMRKMGYGKAPAITTVDMAKAWMSEGHPFTCDHSEEVCAEALKVLEAGRKLEYLYSTLQLDMLERNNGIFQDGMKKYL
ncbi:N-carbamoylsarcosine amidase domain protein [[Clostridium] sordellii ATCC 9714]|nr:N-carbamoylsarcosine amidase domain protein [[Clostridium] sordellii ATCC 9714] [Paeniclostridium sordellii ATCC 9714]